MINWTLFSELRSAPHRTGAGLLALVLSVAPVSFAQSQSAPVASPTNAGSAPVQRTLLAQGNPQAAPAQPATGAAPLAASESTRASAESEAANRDMQAELEPTPGGLTADEIIREAFLNSPALAKAELDFAKADANEARAKLAFTPRFDFAVGYTRLSAITQPGINFADAILAVIKPEAIKSADTIREEQMGKPPPKPLFAPVLNQYSASASVSLPVTEIFLSVIPTYKATKKLKEVSQLQREATKLQISYDARVAFYDYARLRGSASVARASVRVREAGVRDLTSLVEAGTATGTELVRAQAELASARLLETQAIGGIEIALARIEQLTGTPVDRNRGVGEPFIGIDVGPTPSLESVRSAAKNARPELLALNALVGARQHIVSARKGAQYPKLVGRGGALVASPNPRYIPPTKDIHDTYEAGVTLSWSPYDFAYAHTQVTDAETDLAIVREDKRAFELGILTESTTPVEGHRYAAEQILERTQALDAARRYEADQRALLLAGAATPNDVLLAQRDLLTASLNWLNAFIAGRVAQAALLKTQGQTGLAN